MKNGSKKGLRRIGSKELLSISLTAKLIIKTDVDGKERMPQGIQKILVGGVILAPGDIVGSEHDQMWECDVIIIPNRKFEEFKYSGGDLDQMLIDGFEKRESWKREVPV